MLDRVDDRVVAELALDETGRIRSDTVFCGGRWPAALLAQMAATL